MNMTKISTRLAALLFLAGISLACSTSGPVNIGNTQVIGAKLSDYAASWDGYAEAYTFMPSGSDRVRLTIDANGQGTLQVGDGTLLPTPTDPSVGYPPGSTITGPNAATFNGGNNFVLGEGALYPIHAPQVQTNRIQLGLKSNDYYGAWCALQPPIATSTKLVLEDPNGVIIDGGAGGAGGFGGNGGGGMYVTVPGSADAGDLTTYNCLPDWGSGSGTTSNGNECDVGTPSLGEDGGTQPPTITSERVDCGKLALCSFLRVCACTASSCVASPQLPADATASQYPVELDAALDSTGTTLTGTLAINVANAITGETARVTVRLQKK